MSDFCGWQPKAKPLWSFVWWGQQAGHRARGGHICEHVTGLGGLKTHAGLHVHIHLNV